MSTKEFCSKIRFYLTPIASAIILMQLSGCMTLPTPMLEPDVSPAALKVPTGMDQDFVDIEAGFESGDMFMLKPMDSTGVLPNKMVPSFSLNEVGIFDTMRMLIADTGLTLNIEGGTRGSEAYGAVSMYNVKGKLKDVIDDLSESMGFFYSVRKNTLHIQPEQQFVIQLPPALSDDNMAGLTNTLQFLGAKEAYIDRLSRSLVFKSNRPSLAKIEQYLNSIRESRSMIIYAMNIFQVDLKHNADTGIQWNKVGWAAAPGASVAAGPGKSATANGTGLGLGLVLSGTNFSVDMLVNFLKTQGTVKAISQPRLGVINGTKGTLSVGQTLTYVSKVGTTYATSLNQITTETKDLKTGVDISVYGDVSDNTVYTHLDLKISDVVKINKYTALGTDLTLPQTVNRDLNTVVRARPGDMILVGGITIDRDIRENNSGATKNGISTEVSRSEMVLALRTKVINFLPKKKTLVAPTYNDAPPTPPLFAPAVAPAPAVAIPAVASNQVVYAPVAAPAAHPQAVSKITADAPAEKMPVKAPVVVQEEKEQPSKKTAPTASRPAQTNPTSLKEAQEIVLKAAVQAPVADASVSVFKNAPPKARNAASVTVLPPSASPSGVPMLPLFTKDALRSGSSSDSKSTSSGPKGVTADTKKEGK